MLPLPSRSYTRPSTLAVLVVTLGIFSMHAQSTYRGRGKGADRIYPIPELNTVTQSTANTEPDLLPDADVAEGLLSEPLKCFALPSVSGDMEPSPLGVKNFRYIGSYNWLDAPRPTIMVPGIVVHIISSATLHLDLRRSVLLDTCRLSGDLAQSPRTVPCAL